jgi:murein DD-endopeptidase MepM/ murein hydrolase activator NlpD
MMKKKLYSVLAILALLLLIPQSIQNPVEGATSRDYDPHTFWHPWGDHHHHGADIFAKRGTPVHPACAGIVFAVKHDTKIGGNIVSIVGLHGRAYYYAHLDEIDTHIGALVTKRSVIGTVGNTGNAAHTDSHLHFSIFTLFPRFSQWVPTEKRTLNDDWLKPFFVDPTKALKGEQLF